MNCCLSSRFCTPLHTTYSLRGISDMQSAKPVENIIILFEMLMYVDMHMFIDLFSLLYVELSYNCCKYIHLLG